MTEFNIKPNLATVFIMSTCNDVIGSGTTINIANRLFIASAGHVIEQLGSLSVNILSRTLEEGRVVKVIDSGSKGEPYDIGYIEILPSELPKIFKNALSFSEIQQNDDVYSNGAPIVFCGYPEDWSKMDRTTSPYVLKTTSFTFSTRIVEPERWPSEWRRDIHLAIDLNPSENVDLKGNKVTRPHPEGMSGGGFWKAYNLDIPNLLTPLQFNWVGIQVSYHSGLQLAKGTLAYHWISLVREQKSELYEYLQGIK